MNSVVSFAIGAVVGGALVRLSLSRHFTLPSMQPARIIVQRLPTEGADDHKPADSYSALMRQMERGREEREAYERGEREGELDGESYGRSRARSERGW